MRNLVLSDLRMPDIDGEALAPAPQAPTPPVA
jgi:hypothetical protein